MSGGDLRIGTLSRRTGVPVRTLRFYADAGLFGDLPRTEKGYRLFPAAAEQELRLLQAAQAAGLGLPEIGELLALVRRSEAPCGEVRTRLRGRLAAVEAQMAALAGVAAVLRRALDTPDGTDHPLGCDLLGAWIAASPFKEEP